MARRRKRSRVKIDCPFDTTALVVRDDDDRSPPTASVGERFTGGIAICTGSRGGRANATVLGMTPAPHSGVLANVIEEACGHVACPPIEPAYQGFATGAPHVEPTVFAVG